VHFCLRGLLMSLDAPALSMMVVRFFLLHF
jgi:hypothetical protein